MKKILLIALSICSIFFTLPNASAATATGANLNLTAAGVMGTITDVMNSLADYGAYETDVAKQKIYYYNDRIYRFGGDLAVVLEECEKETREDLVKNITRRMTVLKEQGFLTIEVHDKNLATYTNWFGTGTFAGLPKIYKDFNQFYDSNLNSTVPQDAVYSKLKLRIEALLSENKITKEKHDTWLVKVYTQIYQHKSDADYIIALFEDEALNYTKVLPVVETTTTVTGDKAFDAYYAAVKKSSLKRFEKLPKKNLQTQLTRAKKIATKYKPGTALAKKQAALIKLLEEVIAKK